METHKMSEFLPESPYADFFSELNNSVQEELTSAESSHFHPEQAYTQLVLDYLHDEGVTKNEPIPCHYLLPSAGPGMPNIKISGYALSPEGESLDIFVAAYDESPQIGRISKDEVSSAAKAAFHFLNQCAKGDLDLEISGDAYDFGRRFPMLFGSLHQIRILVLTNRVNLDSEKRGEYQFQDLTLKQKGEPNKIIRVELFDLARHFRHWSDGRQADELVADFRSIKGGGLPCVFIPGTGSCQYDCALTAIPGEELRKLYDRFGGRLLEANVRSFLSAKGKGVNAGVQDTLLKDPQKFLAYNNGVVIVASQLGIINDANGYPIIESLVGLQIVNGGQTTASLYFSKIKEPHADFSAVRVPAKIICIKDIAQDKKEELIENVAHHANSQNAVKQSDLFANKPYHIALEKTSSSTYCPDKVTMWFYERAAGSYATFFAKNAKNKSQKDTLKAKLHPSRKLTKTDIAKYVMAWGQKPAIVSKGNQKCFNEFMAEITKNAPAPIATNDYKDLIAKAIIYKETARIVKTFAKAFQANITVYTVSALSRQLGSSIKLSKIWANQVNHAIAPKDFTLSKPLRDYIETLAREIDKELQDTANGRMISEWAKRTECEEKMTKAMLSPPPSIVSVPECATP